MAIIRGGGWIDGSIERARTFAADASNALAGLPDSIAEALSRIFGDDIDFHTDLRRGDPSVWENRVSADLPLAYLYADAKTRKLLDLATSDITDSSRIMIIESGKVTVGLLVDSVAEVVNIALSDIDPPPSVGNDEGSRYIQGVYSSDQQILILIDLNKLINEENRDSIGMF